MESPRRFPAGRTQPTQGPVAQKAGGTAAAAGGLLPAVPRRTLRTSGDLVVAFLKDDARWPDHPWPNSEEFDQRVKRLLAAGSEDPIVLNRAGWASHDARRFKRKRKLVHLVHQAGRILRPIRRKVKLAMYEFVAAVALRATAPFPPTTRNSSRISATSFDIWPSKAPAARTRGTYGRSSARRWSPSPISISPTIIRNFTRPSRRPMPGPLPRPLPSPPRRPSGARQGTDERRVDRKGVFRKGVSRKGAAARPARSIPGS